MNELPLQALFVKLEDGVISLGFVDRPSPYCTLPQMKILLDAAESGEGIRLGFEKILDSLKCKDSNIRDWTPEPQMIKGPSKVTLLVESWVHPEQMPKVKLRWVKVEDLGFLKAQGYLGGTEDVAMILGYLKHYPERIERFLSTRN